MMVKSRWLYGFGSLVLGILLITQIGCQSQNDRLIRNAMSNLIVSILQDNIKQCDQAIDSIKMDAKYYAPRDFSSVKRWEDLRALQVHWRSEVLQNCPDWQIWESQEGVFIISGYGLGISQLGLTIGQWRYFIRNGKFEPVDVAAINLTKFIDSR